MIFTRTTSTSTVYLRYRLVILADQRRSLHFCPVFAARTSAISGIKKRPSSMSLVYCSTGTACCQQNSPKYAEIFYQDRIVHRCPANCNTLFVRGGSGQEMILRTIFPARRTILLFFLPKKPYASDLEYAFFIWLLSSKSTLCSVAPVSFFSISAILLFASSLNCVCFVSSVSPQAAHRTDGSVHGLLPSPFPDTAQCGR